MVLLDIDHIAAQMAASRLTGHNRWNWASFHDADHFGDPDLTLRQRLVRDAEGRGLTLPDGPIFLLTHLRYLGYCFNPVSFFYCHDRTGALRLVLAEVNNTFGGSHNYWLQPEPREASATSSTSRDSAGTRRVFRATTRKALHVSPFMPADMVYAFAFSQSHDRLIAHISLERLDAAAVNHTFDASLSLDCRPWTATEIRRALVRHPAMTASVIAGIHLEALKLWWKGLPVIARHTPDAGDTEQPDGRGAAVNMERA
jgi:uncharacterized protein